MSKIVSIKSQTPAEADALLAAIVDSSYDAIVSKDLNSIITSWNTAAERLFGYTAEEAIGQSVLMLIPEHLRNEETEIIAKIRRGERVDSYETIRRRKDGTLAPVSLTISPVRNSRGEIVGASKIARDISTRMENERRICLLMRELNHRVKNQFAVILSMVRETANRTDHPKEFAAQIRERIAALARSHDLLVTNNWSGASLFDLIQEHLKPFGHEDQISLSGPLLTLQANAVQYLGIAFHELGTNSAKYGALSNSTGALSVTWRIVRSLSGEREMELVWEERSVPTRLGHTQDSSHSGFGTVVLKRVAPQALSGSAILDKQPGLLRWTLAAPLSSVVLINAED